MDQNKNYFRLKGRKLLGSGSNDNLSLRISNSSGNRAIITNIEASYQFANVIGAGNTGLAGMLGAFFNRPTNQTDRLEFYPGSNFGFTEGDLADAPLVRVVAIPAGLSLIFEPGSFVTEPDQSLDIVMGRGYTSNDIAGAPFLMYANLRVFGYYENTRNTEFSVNYRLR